MLLAAFYFLSAGTVGWLLTRRLFAGSSPSDRLVVGIVLAQAALLLPVHVAAALQLVGVLERVSYWNVAAGHLVVLCVAAAFSRRSQPSVQQKPPRGNTGAVPVYLKIAALALGGAYAIGAVNGLSNYVRDYDAVSYHLVLPLHWMLDGTFAITEATNWRFALPANGEATMYLLLAGGNESLLVLAQWAPLVCLAAAAYSLAMSLCGRREAALCCTAVLLTSPIIYFQFFSAYVDLFATAFLLAAFALAERSLRASEGERARWVAAAGLACGIAIGSKTLYLALAAILVAALVALQGWRDRRRGLKLASVLLLGIAIPSLFWFARAALSTGNPLFPLEVKIGEWVVFAGLDPNRINPIGWALGRWVRSEAEWLIYPWVEYRSYPSMTTYNVDTGLGGAFAAFVPLGLAFLGWTAWRRRTDWKLWFWLGAWLVCGLIWWFPSHQTLRFGLVFIALSVVLAAPLLTRLIERRSRLFEWTLCASIAVTCAIVSLDPLSAISSRFLFDLWSRADVHHYASAIDELPDGSRVLNLVRPQNFVVAGERLSHRVVGFFEAPQQLTSEFLQRRHIDFVVGHDGHEERVAGLPDVELFRREVVHDPVGKHDQVWMIWKVERPAD